MNPSGKRDYPGLVARIEQLALRGWQIRQWGEAGPNHPILSLERPAPQDRPTILVVGGIHGNEPAGTEAAMRWMEQAQPEHDRFGWLVIPCANPTGWECDRRTNALRKDLNRHFRDPTCCPECAALQRATDGRQFVFSMDFHEDDEAPGYYLCEIRKNPPFAGEAIVEAVRLILPIWKAKQLDGRAVASEGCVRRFPVTEAVLRRRRLWPLEFHLLLSHTSHTFCSETPMGFPMKSRVAAHHAALKTACRFAEALI